MVRPWKSRCPDPRGWITSAALVVVLGCAESQAPLVIETPEQDQDAEVYVDGNFVGLVSNLQGPDQTVKLGPGKHRVEVRKPGRFPYQRTVEVKRGQTRPLKLEPELLTDPP